MSHPSPDELEDDHVPVDLGGSSFAVTRRTPKNPNSKKALGMMSSWTMTTTLHTIYLRASYGPLSHETQVVRECLFVYRRQQIFREHSKEPETEGGLETLWRQAG
jgi:hypothetical protein